jgi:hypothetical protein
LLLPVYFQVPVTTRYSYRKNKSYAIDVLRDIFSERTYYFLERIMKMCHFSVVKHIGRKVDKVPDEGEGTSSRH